MPSLITSALTSNTTPAPYVASASDQYNPAYRAFDKSNSSNWLPGPSKIVSWLQIDLGSAQQCDSYQITAAIGTQTPKAWTLQGSNDGVSFTVVDTRSAQTGWTSAPRSFTVASPGAYRYYRLNVTAGNDATYVYVTELDLIGAPPTPQGALAGTLGQLGGAFSGTHTAPPVSGSLSAGLPQLVGGFAGQDPDAPNPATLAGSLGKMSGAFAGDFQRVVASSTTFANYGYGYTGVGQVDYMPPIAATPARVRRVKVQRVHQSLPAPTLENGRPV